MSRKSWLHNLVHRVSKTAAHARKRPAFAPVRVELLESRDAPATLTWTGAAGTTWSNSGNWTPSGVPSATNNTLNFNSTGTTSFTSTNDIAGLTGLQISVTDSDNAAGHDFLISGSGSTSTPATIT